MNLSFFHLFPVNRVHHCSADPMARGDPRLVRLIFFFLKKNKNETGKKYNKKIFCEPLSWGSKGIHWWGALRERTDAIGQHPMGPSSFLSIFGELGLFMVQTTPRWAHVALYSVENLIRPRKTGKNLSLLLSWLRSRHVIDNKISPQNISKLNQELVAMAHTH